MESRRSFCRTDHPLSSQFMFYPKVIVLSLTSTSHSPELDLSRYTASNKKKGSKERSNRITIETVDGVEQELPLRTREYRRRKHEWAERYTSQEGLREAFGRNRNRVWGDLDANTARRLYKRLLFPTAISELVLELGDEIVRPEELAPLAYEARKAAKMYVRERCRVPSRVGAYLIDGFRQWYKYGKFQPNGASYEQLWIRYYQENGGSNNTDEELKFLLEQNDVDNDVDVENIIDEIDDAVTEEEIVKRTCQKILEKSCTTNEAIDRFYLKTYGPNGSGEEDNDLGAKSSSDNIGKSGGIVNVRKGYGQRWRNRKKRMDRYNDLLLKRITKTLERDVRKLLEPSPLSLYSSFGSGEDGHLYREYRDEHEECNQRTNRIGNSETGRKEGDWSSRRMTRQEYHSLKLFAKARKHSEQQDRETYASDATKRATSGDSAVNNLSHNVEFVSQTKIGDRKSTRDEKQ